MTGGNISPGVTAQTEPIHHATVAGYSTPTACGRTVQPKPAASEWRYVTCEACREAAPRGTRMHDLPRMPHVVTDCCCGKGHPVPCFACRAANDLCECCGAATRAQGCEVSDKARMLAQIYTPHGVGHQGPRAVLALRRLNPGTPKRGRPEAQLPLGYVMAPADVACPSCGSAKGQPCTLNGKPKATPHRTRRWVASPAARPASPDTGSLAPRKEREP